MSYSFGHLIVPNRVEGHIERRFKFLARLCWAAVSRLFFNGATQPSWAQCQKTELFGHMRLIEVCYPRRFVYRYNSPFSVSRI